MGRLGSSLVIVLLLAASTALASGPATRHYLWFSGSEGPSSPPGGLAATLPFEAYRQREGETYVMRFAVASDTVLGDDAFHLHLAEHVAFVDGEHATRVRVVDDADPSKVLADATFTVQRAAFSDAAEDGWTDFTLDAVTGQGFAASGGGALVPGGTLLRLEVTLASAPGPDYDPQPVRDAWSPVADELAAPPTGGPGGATLDAAAAAARDVTGRPVPAPSAIVNQVHGDAVAPLLMHPVATAEALERVLGSPVPAAQFRFVTEDDASFLDVHAE